MRRLGPLLGAGVVLAFSLGCLRQPDEEGVLALDYEIDRTRVVAIRALPLSVLHPRPVTVDALVLAPRPIDRVEASICGLREDVRVEIGSDATCFSNPDLVEPIATELPFRWRPPDLSHLDCDEAAEDTGPFVTDGCVSEVPLKIDAWADGDRGSAVLEVPIRLYSGPERPPTPLVEAWRELEVRGEPRRGGELGLVFKIESEAELLSFRWYIDQGELYRTGRTITQRKVGNVHTTVNRLTVPTTWIGPLRIAVVVVRERDSADLVDDVTWELVTVEVPE